MIYACALLFKKMTMIYSNKKNMLKRIAGIVAFGLMVSGLYTGTALAYVHINSQMALGSSGTDVSSLQTFLASDNTIYPSGLVTGYYGPLTEQAVTQFQAMYGLDQVGNVGPLTLTQLNSLIDSGQSIGSTGQATSVITTDTAPIITNVTVNTASGTVLGTTSTITTSATQAQNVVVSWNTNELASGKVYYSSSPLILSEAQLDKTEPTVSGGFVVTDPSITGSKAITISGLTSGTTYYYMIESMDANNNVSVTWPSTFVAQ